MYVFIQIFWNIVWIGDPLLEPVLFILAWILFFYHIWYISSKSHIDITKSYLECPTKDNIPDYRISMPLVGRPIYIFCCCFFCMYFDIHTKNTTVVWIWSLYNLYNALVVGYISILKGLFMNFSKLHSRVKWVLNIFVSCKMALYVGCTT